MNRLGHALCDLPVSVINVIENINIYSLGVGIGVVSKILSLLIKITEWAMPRYTTGGHRGQCY